MTITDEKNWVAAIGKPAMDSIREMVTALECVYERLEELRDERQEFIDEWKEAHADTCPENGRFEWEAANPDDAKELEELEQDAGDCESQEEAANRIQEDALDVQVRSDWVSLGNDMEPAEYNILLTTGGPAVRIIGEIRDGEAYSARLEVQDWFKPWTEFITTGDDHDALLTYARQFCFER